MKNQSIRLQKYIADCGVTSRRKAEELILQGRVSVNYKVIIELSYRIDPDRDEVFIDGERVKTIKNAYYLLNKPRGTISTTNDEKNRKTVVEMIKTKEKISNLEDRLPGSFLRIHRSFIINKDRLKSFSYDQVLVDDIQLNIGRTYRKQVKESLGGQ